jgi:hypothetical protein
MTEAFPIDNVLYEYVQDQVRSSAYVSKVFAPRSGS